MPNISLACPSHVNPKSGEAFDEDKIHPLLQSALLKVPQSPFRETADEAALVKHLPPLSERVAALAEPRPRVSADHLCNGWSGALQHDAADPESEDSVELSFEKPDPSIKQEKKCVAIRVVVDMNIVAQMRNSASSER